MKKCSKSLVEKYKPKPWSDPLSHPQMAPTGGTGTGGCQVLGTVRQAGRSSGREGKNRNTPDFCAD